LTRNNIRNLVRCLYDNPKDFDVIKGRKKNIWEEYDDFLNVLKSIRVIYLKKLSTSAQEEKNFAAQI